MEKSAFENNLKMVIQGLEKSVLEEADAEHGNFADRAIRCIPNADPETLSILVEYPLQQAYEQVLLRYSPEAKTNRKLRNALKVWADIYSIVGELVAEVHGTMVCCKDCSRWIANRYIDYAAAGKLPDMTIDEKCYYKPDFGSAEDWMRLCDEIVNLYYGKATEFTIAYQKLRHLNDDKTLSIAALRKMDGEPVWAVCHEEDAMEPLEMWVLVEVTDESVFLTNNLGGRTEYFQDDELEADGILLYRHPLKKA